jgi:hypothetical protein
MGNLKHLTIALAVLLAAATALAQGGDVRQKAFAASYAAETNGDYAGAIAQLGSVYEETSY